MLKVGFSQPKLLNAFRVTQFLFPAFFPATLTTSAKKHDIMATQVSKLTNLEWERESIQKSL